MAFIFQNRFRNKSKKKFLQLQVFKSESKQTDNSKHVDKTESFRNITVFVSKFLNIRISYLNVITLESLFSICILSIWVSSSSILFEYQINAHHTKVSCPIREIIFLRFNLTKLSKVILNSQHSRWNEVEVWFIFFFFFYSFSF